MVRFALVLLYLFGFGVLAVVVWSLWRPKLIPPKSQEADISVLGSKYKGPVAFGFGIIAVVVATVLWRDGEHVQLRTEIAGFQSSSIRSEAIADSLTGRITELELLLAAAQTESDSILYQKLRFGVMTPLPSLGRGISAGLAPTEKSHIDVLLLRGIEAYSDSTQTEYIDAVGDVRVQYGTHPVFLVKLKNGERWEVSHLGRLDETYNMFQFILLGAE